MLNSIDTPVGDLDNLVQSDEGSLQRSQLHQQFDGALVILFQLSQLLTSSRESSQLVCVRAFRVWLEDWQVYTWQTNADIDDISELFFNKLTYSLILDQVYKRN